MKPIRYLVMIMLIFFSFACSEDDEESALTKDGPFAISELNGAWEATKAQFSVSTHSVDVVEDGGTAEMMVSADGKFTITLDPIDRDAYSVGGEMFWEEWKGTFYFAIVWNDEPNDWDTYGYTYDGITLSLNGGSGTGEYDFNNDGTMEACTVHFIFVRSD